MTILITSTRVAGLPSLPAVERSIAERVIESAKTGCFTMVALIRGPPQAEVEGALETDGEGVREGKAASDRGSNSTLLVALTLGLVATVSAKAGNGSGAPSSVCFFYQGG